MNIQQLLSLRFTAISAMVLLVFSMVVYFSAAQNRHKEYDNSLYKEAITKANLLLDAGVDTLTLQTIYRKNREVLREVEVAIYDTRNHLLYHDDVEIDFVKESPAMLEEINRLGRITFSQDGWQVVGFAFDHPKGRFLITAAGYDEYGYDKLIYLRQSLVLSFVFCLLLIYLAGRFFSRKAMQPVAAMTAEARKISATKLDLRIYEGEGKDELSELANTFNQLLERLEKSFDAQKSFVSNIAHELRTPLAAIITELEWSLAKEREPMAYRQSIQAALADAQRLNRVSAALLDLAKASYDSANINFEQVRLDELLMDARQDVMAIDPIYKVDIQLDEKKSNPLIVSGNAYLLRTAFANLMENACKYSSDAYCLVSLHKKEQRVQISFQDQGQGIDEQEIEKVFEPFYRSDTGKKAGSGIGLSLVKRIVELHRGNIKIVSKKGQGSKFRISLRLT
jgi:two-component system, OmpR family, sensor histidine kinase ArlS